MSGVKICTHISHVPIFVSAETTAPVRFYIFCTLLRRVSSEPADTTVGCAASVESVSYVYNAERDLSTICAYSQSRSFGELQRPRIRLQTKQRLAGSQGCCSAVQCARGAIMSGGFLRWWWNRCHSSSSSVRRQGFMNFTCVLTPLHVFKPQAIKNKSVCLLCGESRVTEN